MAEYRVVKTTCGICSQGCLVDAYVSEGVLQRVEGSKSNKSQSGKLCVKGLAAKQYVYNKDRIHYPMKRVGKKGEGKFERISWDEAYEMIAANLLKVKEAYGARSTIFYNGYPKWFRPPFLRLSNAYGSPNFCTESSTCFQSVAMAWRSIYGNAVCRPDLKNTKTLLIWSANLYHSNSAMSPMYQKLKAKGVQIIAVDTRHSVTAHDANIHLQPEVGTDGALALAMAHVIISENLYHKEFVDQYVHGFEAFQEYASQFTPEYAEQITKVPAELIRQAAYTFATNSPASIMFSASAIVHHINGVQNQRAIFSLLAITGNYDVEGGNCPNPSDATLYNEFHQVKRYNKEEAIGEQDFPAWFDLCEDEAQCTRLSDYIVGENPYPIKALFSMGFNHRMWPQPGRLKESINKLDFFVNVELFLSDSSDAADLVLPACTSYERDEVQVNKGGRLFFSPRAIEPVGEAKNDIEIIMEVMKRMNLHDDVLANGYDAYMQHIIEPSSILLDELKNSPDGLLGKNYKLASYKSYETKLFQTPSGKIELESTVLGKYIDSHGYDTLPVFYDYREQAAIDRVEYPLTLCTGCRKPQYFHAKVNRLPWLAALEVAPLVEMHPEDAKAYSVNEGDIISVISPVGAIKGSVFYNISGRPGTIFIYHGNVKGEVNELISKDYLDPISGFPGYKSYVCKIVRE